MNRLSLSTIRKLHDDYLRSRKEFDLAGGIISPIRAITGLSDQALVDLAIDYTLVDDKIAFIRKKSQPIGFFVACKELATGNIKTAWSLCSPSDLWRGEFDREFGILLAIKRLFTNNPSDSVKSIDDLYMSNWTYGDGLFFGVEYTIGDQAQAFLKRCDRYYKGALIE